MHDVEEIIEVLDKAMTDNEFAAVDCLTALCILAVDTAYRGNVPKPYFLSNLSSWWEEVDKQAHE